MSWDAISEDKISQQKNKHRVSAEPLFTHRCHNTTRPRKPCFFLGLVRVALESCLHRYRATPSNTGGDKKQAKTYPG